MLCNLYNIWAPGNLKISISYNLKKSVNLI